MYYTRFSPVCQDIFLIFGSLTERTAGRNESYAAKKPENRLISGLVSVLPFYGVSSRKLLIERSIAFFTSFSFF